MADIIIDVSELRSKNAEKELTEFLEAKLGVNITVEADAITINTDIASKEYLRVLIRKFLHRSDLKERFRPISAGERMIIKRRKKHEE